MSQHDKSKAYQIGEASSLHACPSVFSADLLDTNLKYQIFQFKPGHMTILTAEKPANIPELIIILRG